MSDFRRDTGSTSGNPVSDRRKHAWLALVIALLLLAGGTVLVIRPGHDLVLDPPTFIIDSSLSPSIPELPPWTENGPPRPLVRLADALGHEVDFVANELLLITDNAAALDGFLARWNGTVVHATKLADVQKPARSSYIVRVDAMRGDPAGLVADVRAMDRASRGEHRLSNEAALHLVAAAAASAREGLTVGVNALFESHSFSDDAATEATSGEALDTLNYDQNAMNWAYMKQGNTQSIGVTDAWKMLELAGKIGGDPVDIAILDGGFIVQSRDYPDGWTDLSVMPGQPATGKPNIGQPSKPWHGTNVAMVAAAKVDNGFGTAGPGGPVAHLITVNTTGDAGAGIVAISAAVGAGADIINMSYSIDWPASVSFLGFPFSMATAIADGLGVMVIASAGNDGEDVDAEDCFVFCWEETFWSPCENAEVICVGGLATDSLDAHPNSNFGHEWCESAQCDVDIFGPFTVYVGHDGDNSGESARARNGTSYAAPFVAGVAALIWAADRDGLNDDDVEYLLRHWAHHGRHWKVDRYVNAAESVYRALGGSIPTYAAILEPPHGRTVSYGGLNAVKFRAEGHDSFDGGGCCTFQWSSDVDGNIGFGAEMEHTFASPGDRVVTLTATAADGGATTRTVTLNVTNEPPIPQIVAPAAGEDVPRSVGYKLEATVLDPNEGLRPCNYLTWTSTEAADQKANGGSFPVMGCTAFVTLRGSNGLRVLTLKATDMYGAAKETNVFIDVVDPPAHPSVVITHPIDTLFQPGEKVDLLADTVEQDGDTVSYKWWLVHGANKHLIDGTEDVHGWLPSDLLPSTCGVTEGTLVLEASDKDGTGTASLDIGVMYGPC